MADFRDELVSQERRVSPVAVSPLAVSPLGKTLCLFWIGSVFAAYLFSWALHTSRLGPLLRRLLGH